MTETSQSSERQPGTVAMLPCGHAMWIPWGLSPEAALADVLRHGNDCDLESRRPLVYGFSLATETPFPALGSRT